MTCGAQGHCGFWACAHRRLRTYFRAGALEAVQVVAADAAKEIVTAMGGTVDDKKIAAAVDARMKG